MSVGSGGPSQRELEINSSVQFDPFTQGLKHNINRELRDHRTPRFYMIHEHYQRFGMH